MTLPAKTQEQRIKAAAEAMRRNSPQTWEEIARIALEAADAPPTPTWPVDESLDAVWSQDTSSVTDREVARDRLRTALLADPIIKAAIDLRDVYFKGATTNREVRRLIQAVDDALGAYQPH